MIDGKKITIEIDGIVAEGEFLHLYPNDMEVLITSPYSGEHTGLHLAHFAMHPVTVYSTMDGQITQRGIKIAELLLRELYQSIKNPEGRTDN